MNSLGEIIQKFVNKTDSVLSLGCGILAEIEGIECNRFFGVDIYQPYIDFLKTKNIDVVCQNILDFESKDCSYDVVLLIDVIEHLEKEDAKKIIKKAKRICSKNVIIYTPSKFFNNKTETQDGFKGNFHQFLNEDKNSPYFGFGINNNLEHLNCFTKKELEECDFKIIQNPSSLINQTIKIFDENIFAIYENTKETEVSIVIPAFNYSNLLEHCLDSLSNQKIDFKYEVIVVDDGNENLKTICDNFSKKFNLKYLKISDRTEKRGLSVSVNRGVMLAKGKIIVQMGRDIYLFNNNAINEMVYKIIDNKKNISFPSCLKDDNGDFLYALKNKNDDIDKIFNKIPNMINKYFGFCFCYNKDTFFDLYGYDEDFSEGIFYDDNDFIDRLKKYGCSFIDVNCSVVHLYHERDYSSELSIKKINTNYILYEKKRKKEGYKSDTSILKPLISIIIPTYNHLEDCLKPCIESIIKYTDLTNIEIIIVANGCTDKTEEYVKSLGPHFRLIWINEPVGYIKSTNEGIKQSFGEFIILLNNDTILLHQNKNDWINLLIEPLKDKSIGVVGSELMQLKLYNDNNKELLNRNFIVFFCAAMRKELFDELGLLDETFSPGYCEDIDFCFKAENAGYKNIEVCKNNFPIHHIGNSTFSKEEKKASTNLDIIFEKYQSKNKTFLQKNPLISIIIPTHNHLEDALKPCLEKLFLYTNIENKEIIVVPNGCIDETKEFLESFGDKIKVIWITKSDGAITPINEGIKESNGKYVIFLDNDSFLIEQQKDDWVNILLKPFLENDKVGVTGPFINYYENIGNVIHSGCAMYLKKALKEVNGGDPIFTFGYFYDSDLSLRIEKKGYKAIGVPENKALTDYKNGIFGINFPIYHLSEGITMKKDKDIELIKKNREILYQRHMPKEIIKLNLGSGGEKIPGYISVDKNDPRADIKSDVFDIDYKEDSVDEIIMSHLLEHINPYKVEELLKNLYKILKPNGKLIIEVPDIEKLCKNFEKGTKEDRYGILNCIYGSVNTKDDIYGEITSPHLWGWSKDILWDHLSYAGFEGIIFEEEQFPHPGYNFRAECKKKENKKIKISIIIPTYKKHLKECIDSLLKFTDMSDKEIIIVANGCDEKNSEYIKEINNKNFIKIIWFKDPIGYPKAINVGVKESNTESEFLIFLNDDIVLLEQEKDTWTNLLCDPLIKDDSLIATGPLKKEYNNEYFLIFFCCAIKKNLFYKVGYLDERFFPGGCEDIDWCLRAIKLGYKLLEISQNGSFPIFHLGGFTMYEINNSNKEILEKNIKLLLKKHNIQNIYDCFMFNDELDVLEIRFDELYETVDKIVLVEATKTHSGKDKPLYFQENKKRYEKYLDKIRHIIVDDFPETNDSWVRERFQREAISRGLYDCNDNDIIITGDADEIPCKKIIEGYNINQEIIGIEMKYSFYFLNCVRQDKIGTNHLRIVPYKILNEIGHCAVRYNNTKIIKEGGWHFSFLGDIDSIIKKIESYAHQEYNTDYYKDKEKLKKKIEKAEDILEKNMEFKYVKIDNSFPDFVIKNEKKLIEKGLIKKMKTISIIIPTFNLLEKYLKPCIKSILEHTNLDDTEIIIVANGCNDGTEEYVKSLGEPFKLLSFKEPLGYPKAVNNGIKESVGEYIVLLNNDTTILNQVKNSWINQLIEPLEQNEKLAATGPLMGFSPEVEDHFLIFFCVAIKKKVIEEIGMLDEIFGLGAGEDTDWCMKAKKAGYEIKQIPDNESIESQGKYGIGSFPIFHEAEATVDNIPEWKESFKKNSEILKERYQLKNKIFLHERNEEIKYSVIIPTYNHLEDCLKPCLEGIRKYTNLENMEILVVANGCNNETKDYVQSLEKQFILLWSNEKLGYTKATNKGIERAKGKYIILLNNDTEIIGGYKNEWVDRLNEPFNNINEKIGITCSHTLYSPEVEDEFAIFYNVMIPRKIINEIGLLDEIFSPGFGEDIDYCMKIKKHGYTICNVSHNGYPMNHKSGQTFHDKENHEDYEKTVKKNQDTLYQRYVTNKSNEITATIVTKNRYFDTLPLAIESVINQTLKPKKLILYDNGDKIDLRKLPIYQSLFSKLDQKGIQWEVIFIDEPGQIHGHQHAIENVKTEWIWRLDDDEAAEPNVLETLMKNANNKEIGAIAGLVIDPKNVQTITSSNMKNNKINDIEINIQWFLHKNKEIIEVEHLYSSFLFRTKAGKHGYCMELSPACHREETIFTYEMKKNGWKLLVDTNAITWHYRSEQGGIRSYNDSNFWDKDEKIFQNKLKNWNINET